MKPTRRASASSCSFPWCCVPCPVVSPPALPATAREHRGGREILLGAVTQGGSPTVALGAMARQVASLRWAWFWPPLGHSERKGGPFPATATRRCKCHSANGLRKYMRCTIFI
jgi:hypothetical protein